MPHDKLKAAARRRMAETGEPYAAARRAVVRQRAEARGSASGSVRNGFDVVAAQLTQHGQEVRSHLMSASGIVEIQQRFAALQWFRSLGHSVDDRPVEATGMGRSQWRCRRCGSDLQLDGMGRPVSSSGTGQCLHEQASW